jgi:hypothetical protein
LSDPHDAGALTALDIFYFYYFYGDAKRTPDRSLALELLVHRVFWSNPNHVKFDTMVEHVWKETALGLIGKFPDVGQILVERIVLFFGNAESLLGVYHSDVQQVLTTIAEIAPQAVWTTIEPYLGPPIDRRAYSLTHWLRGEKDGPSPLQLFDPVLIWQWVDKDAEKRARYLASFVPPSLWYTEGQCSLARELLVKYGDRSDVRNAFHANYASELWVGPESSHYIQRSDELLQFKQHETNPNVIKWMDEYLSDLAVRIDHAKAQEEMENRSQRT